MDGGHCEYYPNEESRRKRILQILADESIDGDVVTRDFLRMALDSRLEWAGGYPAAINWDFSPDHVVVADLDPGKEYLAPVLSFYAKEDLEELAFDAMDTGSFDEDGMELDGDARADSIYEFFCMNLHDCVEGPVIREGVDGVDGPDR